MKNKLWIVLAITLFFGACKKDNQFVNEFEEQEWIDDGGNSQQGEDGEASLTLYQVNGNGIDKIRDYTVGANMKPFQQDYAKHLAMWDFVTRLLPFENRSRIVEFEVFHGQGELLGYVAPIDENDLSRWRFALAIDIADQLEIINLKQLFTYVAIHEYGHVLTLNESQIDAGKGSCNNLELQEGCTKSNSYINQLSKLGWEEIFKDLGNSPDPGEVYSSYASHFVSDYAATNPAEDIAEVFSFFITQEDRPTGNTIADQKIQLLYQYPELVELRRSIRQNANVRALKAGSWIDNPLRAKFKFGKHKHHGPSSAGHIH